MRNCLWVFPFVLLALGVGCSAPSENGQTVGRQHRALSDDGRTNWAGDGDRPLATTVWYPASSDSDAAEWSAGVFEFGRSALNAPFMDESKRPLIVLSHGTGSSAAQLSWLAHGLVDAGFVVAATNHHGNTAVEETSWPHGFVLPNERARDLSVLIDKLLADSEIGPHIDSSRIGAGGFSLGGYSALAIAGAQMSSAERQEACAVQVDNPVCNLPPEAGFTDADLQELAKSDPVFQAAIEREGQSIRDDRVRAVYAIAPVAVSLMDSDTLSSARVALRIVLAEDDQQILLDDTLQAISAAGLQDDAVVRVPEAGHYVFLAPCNFRGWLFLSELCRDDGDIDRRALHREIATNAARFFSANL